jgi:hypothetical protein
MNEKAVNLFQLSTVKALQSHIKTIFLTLEFIIQLDHDQIE